MDYFTIHRLEAKFGNQSIWYLTKKGLSDWNQITPSMILIHQASEIEPGARIAYFGCNHGAAAALISKKCNPSEMWLMDSNVIALNMSNLTFLENHLPTPKLLNPAIIPKFLHQLLDCVIIDIPKGRKLARRWLLTAHFLLKDRGCLYISGPKNMGIQSIANDAKLLFNQATTLAYKKGHRIIRFTKNQSQIYRSVWLEEPGIYPGTWWEFSITLDGKPLSISSLPGIFSYDHVDPGTSFLIAEMKILPDAKILDLGCGYGVIGIAASLRSGAWVDLVDNNLLAIASTDRNLSNNQISNAQTYPSDALQAIDGKRYHQILTNPPFHTGRSVDFEMAQAFISQSYQALEPSGELWLVANRFLPYENLLTSHFPKVIVRAENSQYKIILAIK